MISMIRKELVACDFLHGDQDTQDDHQVIIDVLVCLHLMELVAVQDDLCAQICHILSETSFPLMVNRQRCLRAM